MKIIKKKGVGLVLVLTIMAVLSILGVTILNIGLFETKHTVNQDRKMQAYYLAKSGVDTTSTYILWNPLEAQDLVNAPESNVNNQLPNGSFKVDVTPGDASDEIKVKGTGVVAGVSNSSTAILKSLSLSDILDKAIYTGSNLDITGMKVDGDVQSGGTVQYSSTGSHTFSDDAQPNSPREIAFVAPFPSAGATNLVVRNREVTLTSSASYNGISIEQHGILNVNTYGSDVEITVDTLTIDNLLNIDAALGGRVSIYVNNKMTVKTSGVINNAYPKNLFIYLKSGSTFEIQANMVLNGYIIGPDATVEVQSSNSVINGAVYSSVIRKNATGAGPNGTVNYVALPAGSYTGSVTPTEYRVIRWEK